MREAEEPRWLTLQTAIDAVLAADRAADRDLRAEVVAWRRRAGLPVDDAVIETLVSRGVPVTPGTWETADEAARRRRGEAVIAQSAAAVEDYVRAHSDCHAGSWISWTDGEPTFVVAFTDDLERHAEALRFPGVSVVLRARPLQALQRIVDSVSRSMLAGEMPPDTGWVTIGVDAVENVVSVTGMGVDEQVAAAWLAQRYDDRVKLTWWGSAEPRVEPVSWQVWEGAADDARVVTVHWTTNSAYPFQRVDTEEDADTVHITVFETVPAGMTTMAGARRSADVRLEQPIGTRRVLDAVTGRARRRL